jgi:hypothetical protein
MPWPSNGADMKPGALVVWRKHDPESAAQGLVMMVYTNRYAEVIWYTSVGWQRGCYRIEMLLVLKPGFLVS